MNTLDEFINRLKAWREKQGLSQGKAADMLGVARSYLNQIENGRAPGTNFVNTFEAIENQSAESAVAGIGVQDPRRKLTAALAARHLTPAGLAKKIGYDSGVINNVVRGAGRASEAMIEAIVRELPELSKDDLMHGSEQPYILTGSDGNGIYGAKPNIQLPPGMKGRMVPLLSVAQAGAWDAGHSDEGWTGDAVFALNLDDHQAFAIRVSGNSMEPDIREGDVVICSPREHLTPGCCAVVRTRSDQAFVKFWRKRGEVVILESANPDYKPLQFPAAEIAGAWPVVQRIASGMIKKSGGKIE